MFGVEAHPTKGVRILPRVPAPLDGATWSMRYRGGRITFRYHGHGRTITQLVVNGQAIADPGNAPWIAPELLIDGATVDVHVKPKH